MAKPGTVTGWKLPQAERELLLQRFPPKYEKHREAYEAHGVVFVHHRNAEDSLRQLAKIFPSVKAPESA